MVVPQDESEVPPERVCPDCGTLAAVAILAFGAAREERALCAACLRRLERSRELVATVRPCPVPTAAGVPGAAAGCRNTPLHPYRTEAGWEYAACALDDVSAQIDALARQGWECTFVSTPHHGSLMLIGYFRRRVTPSAGPGPYLLAPNGGR